MIVFLYCTPDFDTLFGLFAPQPFVQLYALALGNGGAVFMTVLATVGLVIVRIISVSLIPPSKQIYRIPVSPSSQLLVSSMLSPVMAFSLFLDGSDR
jgi:hypothetical protein